MENRPAQKSAANRASVLCLVANPELSRALTREVAARGHAAVHARDAVAGFDAARTARPGLILLEWPFPDADGELVVASLREAAGLRDMRLVAVMRGGDKATASRALAAGCDRTADERGDFRWLDRMLAPADAERKLPRESGAAAPRREAASARGESENSGIDAVARFARSLLERSSRERARTREEEAGIRRELREANEKLLIVAENGVALFGLSQWAERSTRGGDALSLLRETSEFIESSFAVERLVFEFTAAGCESLRAAANTLERAAPDPSAQSAAGARAAESRLRFPINGRSHALGAFSVVDRAPDPAASEHNRLLLRQLAIQLGLLCENLVLVDRLCVLSETDALTGLLNRRSLMARAQSLLDARRPAALYMIDIDHFKGVNDQYGHVVGDEVLKAMARILEGQHRKGDIVARYGGEEIVVVLADLPAARTRAMGDRIRTRVSAFDWSALGLRRPITVSVGAAFSSAGDADLDAWIGRADDALYRAKAGGRDQVVLADGAERGAEVPAPA